MPYLVDGHNLIPHIPGITLKDLEDELALIRTLEGFARQERTRIEVFFDRAPPSRARSQTFGTVKVHFVRQGTTADQAIVSRLQKMGKEAKNWTVVTADREILAEARSTHSKVMPSVEFASLLSRGNEPSDTMMDKGEAPEISGEEVDYWLDQFNED
jgi:predicted RNA-binding protein with PIN domain